MRIFIGYDERQPVSFHTLAHSIVEQSSEPVSITPLKLSQLPIERGWPKPGAGLTPFTWSRFLVPYLCDFKGWALFLDVDIVLNGDISELFKYAHEDYAVMVSKNEHRFEWASVMLFNCGHSANKILTPAYIENAQGLHGIDWCGPQDVGDLPREWNHLVGYDEPKNAKLIHFTQGVPAYPETIDSEYAETWHKYQREMNRTVPWGDLMGPSVHAVQVNDKRLPKFLFDLNEGKPKPQYEETVKKLMNG